ncbi:hypothetical protein DPMN_118348 [Dreissena polymorpha]|uniref:Uncharacterized protein n=1 Tax=Dreissena polymorpha TaxID=45954 RepID=A0A9D4GKL2_DREPO|nr:hypothetical protein DPMN_118348 [Dreissena polymorpha]
MVWIFGRRVGKNDGDSGCGFGKPLGRFLADLLSRAARGWMGVLVSGAPAVGGSGRGRMRARGGGGARARSAWVRLCVGGVLCSLGTETRYSLLRLTDRRKQPTNSSSSAPDKCTTIIYHILYTTIYRSPPRDPKHTCVALAYTSLVMSGVCVSVVCVCSGSYFPGDDGVWVVLSVLYMSRVRDAPRDPHRIITTRYRAH